MTFLDAFALIAFLAGEPSAGQVRDLLRQGDCWLTTVQLTETLDVLVRVLGHDPRDVDRVLEPLLATELALLDIGEPEARTAAALRQRHYRKGSSELSLADCVLLAAAVPRAATIATSDPPLAAAARTEGAPVEALPDSRGRLP